jgi:carbonic anhydrase/acetyltransferase-like protein (isoleucine patch superfamily)
MMLAWRGLSSAVRGVGATIDAIGAALQGPLAPRESLMPPINRLTFQGKSPSYDQYTFVAPNAAVVGDVTIGPRSSVWYGATLRGDVNAITIGHTTNIQDKCVVHVARHNASGKSQGTTIGDMVRLSAGSAQLRELPSTSPDGAAAVLSMRSQRWQNSQTAEHAVCTTCNSMSTLACLRLLDDGLKASRASVLKTRVRTRAQVTIGHGAIVHACTIESETLIGMGAKVLDGAVVRRRAIVAGGAVVAPGTEVPSGQVWAGCPARFLRDLEPAEEAFLAASAENYAGLAMQHWHESTKTYLVRARPWPRRRPVAVQAAP